MDALWKPVAVGLAVGLVLLVLPEGFGLPLVVAGALVAGWILPERPMVAAVLYLLPAVVATVVRIGLDDEVSMSAGLVVGLGMATLFVAILTHVSAGMALRRTAA